MANNIQNVKMPILIKDYNWRQTESTVLLRIPLRNIPYNKVDIFTSSNYVKVHFPPFIFEACLFDSICEEESKCILSDGEAIFELVKKNKIKWDHLEKSVSKRDMVSIKKVAVEEAQKLAEKKCEEKKELKCARQRECVSKQIALENVVRDKIENLKNYEHKNALDDVMKWKEEETEDDKILLSPLDKAARIYNEKSKNVKIERDIFSNEVDKKKALPSWLEAAMRPADRPPPRKFTTLKLDFSYRAFPTPCRESKLDEENEWLKKQLEARRKIGFVAEDLRPEENDPEWLLQKGMSFHSVGNYLGAVSAYSHAINMWDKIPELYVARSDSQISLGNWRRTLEDTTKALELCRPHVMDNEEMRFKSHVNRGRALLELKKLDAAAADFIEALELRPYDQKVHHLLERVDNIRPDEEPQKQGNTIFIEPEELAN